MPGTCRQSAGSGAYSCLIAHLRHDKDLLNPDSIHEYPTTFHAADLYLAEQVQDLRLCCCCRASDPTEADSRHAMRDPFAADSVPASCTPPHSRRRVPVAKLLKPRVLSFGPAAGAGFDGMIAAMVLQYTAGRNFARC